MSADRPLRSGNGRCLIDSINMLYASYEDVILARLVNSVVKGKKKPASSSRSRPKKQRQKNS